MPSGYFSEKFMNLMNALFAPNPSERPSLADLKAHSWFLEKAASKEEVKADLANRKAIMHKQRQEERAMKRKR